MNIPPGWKLVPIDPPDEMLAAAWAEEITMSEAHSEHGITLHVWHAMLSKAPEYEDETR